MEDSRRNEKSFDFSVLLTAYNIAPLLLSAKFSNDNQTIESPFLGSLLFVANKETMQKKEEKQRFISLEFKHSYLSERTREAYSDLCKIPLPDLARVLVVTLEKRKFYEENWRKEYEQACKDISPQANQRILLNHALILAFNRLFCKANNIQDVDLTSFVKATAAKKCITSEQVETSAATHFFEMLDEIEPESLATCVHTNPDNRLIHVNLPGVEQLIRQRGIQFSVNKRFLDELKLHPSYVQNGKNFRFPGELKLNSEDRPRLKKTWVFDADKF